MSFTWETQNISGVAIVVIIGATLWTLSRKAAEVDDISRFADNLNAPKAETFDLDHVLIVSKSVNPMSSKVCCIGQQHPAALLSENKGLSSLYSIIKNQSYCTNRDFKNCPKGLPKRLYNRKSYTVNF